MPRTLGVGASVGYDRQLYRHDPVGLGSVPFTEVPRALVAVDYTAQPMLEIIPRDPDRDIVASATKLAALGFAPATTLIH